MKVEEALKIAENPTAGYGITDVWQALTVLLDALRAAEGQVVQMREDAARVAEKQCSCDPDGHCLPCSSCVTAKAIRALPARGEVVAVSTFSPAPAVAPVAAPKPPFDAEAALVAMLADSLRSNEPGLPTLTQGRIAHAIEAALAAGRGGGR